jgi:hypothetical protein
MFYTAPALGLSKLPNNQNKMFGKNIAKLAVFHVFESAY